MQTNAKLILLTAWLSLICRTAELPAIDGGQGQPPYGGLGELSSFSTSFMTGQEARNHNIRLAASILNGKMISPGQLFSFNDTIGQRTSDRGFVKATSIEFGNKLNLEGGGICLVSSVLYVSALMAGMEIVERYPHSRQVPYILPGNDATVDFGMKDLKFKNSFTQPVVIETSIRGSRLIIRLLSQIISPYKMLLNSTSHLEDQGMVRIKVFRSRTQNGHVISDELISDDLYPAEDTRRSKETPLEDGVSWSN